MKTRYMVAQYRKTNPAHNCMKEILNLREGAYEHPHTSSLPLTGADDITILHRETRKSIL